MKMFHRSMKSRDVEQIQASGGAFAAIRADGKAQHDMGISWGKKYPCFTGSKLVPSWF